MSVVTAVRKNGKISIASDAQISIGTTTLNPSNVLFESKQDASNDKILEFEENYFGSVGFASMKNALNSIFLKLKKKKLHLIKEKNIYFNTTEQIYDSLIYLHKILESKYLLTPSTSEGEDAFYDSQWHMLLANKYGIWRIAGDRSVIPISNFYSIGDGEEMAIGAMDVLYNMDNNANEIAVKSIETASKFKASCSSPILSYNMEEEEYVPLKD